MLTLLLPLSQEEFEVLDGILTIQDLRWSRNEEKGMPDTIKKPVIDEVRRDSALAALHCLKNLGNREYYMEIFRENLNSMVKEYKEYVSYRNCAASYDEFEILAIKYEGALRKLVKSLNYLGYQRLVERAKEGDFMAIQRLSEMTGYNVSLLEKLLPFVFINHRGRLQYGLPYRRDRVLPLDETSVPLEAIEWWKDFKCALIKEEDVPDPFITDIVWTLAIGDSASTHNWIWEQEDYMPTPPPEIREGGEVYADPTLLEKWESAQRERVRSRRKKVQAMPVPKGLLPVAGIKWIPGGEELDEECCEA